MLIIFIYWILIIAIILPISVVIFKVIDNNLKETPHFSILILLGLSILTLVSSIYSIFLPVNWIFQICLLSFSGFSYIYFKKDIIKILKSYLNDFKETSIVFYLLFFLIFLISLIKSASPVEIFDEGGYYQTIFKCTQEFGIIPGLGNLCPNFAVNTHWHLLTTALSCNFFSLYNINGLFFLIISVLAVKSLKRIVVNNEFKYSNIFFCLTPLLVYRSQLTAASTDIISAYIIWLILYLFIKSIEEGKELELQNVILINIFIFWSFTIKPTSVSIGLIDVYYLIMFLTRKNYRNIIILMSIGFIFIVPWIIRNIILSGYLYVMFPQIDIFSFDWKIPIQYLNFKSQFGIYGSFQPTIKWFHDFWEVVLPKDKILLLITFFTIVYSTVRGYILLKNKKLTLQLISIYTFVVFGLFIWLFSAAEPRYFLFGIGFTLFFLFSEIIIKISTFYKNFSKLVFLMISIVLFLNVVKSYKELFNFKSILVFPAAKPIVNFETIQIDNIIFYKPISYKTETTNRNIFYKPFKKVELDKIIFAWNTPIPSIYSNEILKVIKPRGTKIKEGFKIINNKNDK